MTSIVAENLLRPWSGNTPDQWTRCTSAHVQQHTRHSLHHTWSLAVDCHITPLYVHDWARLPFVIAPTCDGGFLLLLLNVLGRAIGCRASLL